MTKRILVTGASGFLGKVFISRVHDLGWKVLRLNRHSNLSRESDLSVDFDKPELVSVMHSLPPCDGVVHLATHVDFSAEAREEEFFPTNVLATSLLCSKVKEWQSHIVFASSIQVLGNSPLIDESTPPEPAIAYAKAKYLGEEIIRSSGVAHSILRVGGIFGRLGPEHLGLNRVIDSAIDQGKPPSIAGKGIARRNYIYVEDIANVIITCLQDRILGTHLAAGTEILSIAEMFEQICDVFLPGENPTHQKSDEASDMVIKPSQSLPACRPFREALLHIREIDQLS